MPTRTARSNRFLHHTALLLAGALLLALPGLTRAGLIIEVYENTGSNSITFSWSGVIGDSGTATAASTAVDSADFMSPTGANSTSRFSVADRSRGDVSDGGAGLWTYYATYDGSTNTFGTGADNSAFAVSGNTSFYIHPGTGELRVGAVTDGLTDAPDLSTHVFTGSFTISGTLASRGLFTSGFETPLRLWEADAGTGFIDFVVIPEPASAALLIVAAAPLLRRRRR